jgi:hypothetical protein
MGCYWGCATGGWSDRRANEGGLGSAGKWSRSQERAVGDGDMSKQSPGLSALRASGLRQAYIGITACELVRRHAELSFPSDSHMSPSASS